MWLQSPTGVIKIGQALLALVSQMLLFKYGFKWGLYDWGDCDDNHDNNNDDGDDDDDYNDQMLLLKFDVTILVVHFSPV